MDFEYLKELLKSARAARERGASLEEINQIIAKDPQARNVDGEPFIGIASLSAFVENELERPQREARERVGERSALSNAARSFAQGATFDFGDEIAGMGTMGVIQALMGNPAGAAAQFDPERAQASRERVQDIRTAEPLASGLMEFAGGIAIPAGGGGVGALARSGVGRGALAGASAGAIGGGLMGAGAAQPGERTRGAIGGMAGGGLLGGALGAGAVPVGRAIARVGPRLAGSRTRRLARSLRGKSGYERTIDEAMAAADARIDQVSSEFYQPFDLKYVKVADDGIRDALNAPELRLIVKSVSKEVASGDRAPSFKELQIIRRKARKAGGRSPEIEAAGEILDQEMQRVIPGLQGVDRAYAEAKGIVESFETGRKLTANSRPSAEVRRTLNKMSPDEADALREGMISEFVRKLELQEGDPAMVTQMLEAGPEFHSKLREGFPIGVEGDRLFGEFLDIVSAERSAQKFVAKAQRFIPFLLTGIGAGAIGFGAGRALFD